MESPVCRGQGDHGDLHRRLRSRAFNMKEVKAAMRGEAVPASLGRLATQYAIVHGIRHHPDFASGPAACLRGLKPLFTRALNARAIMSNQIPRMSGDESVPYCIWYPNIPSEDTLRELAARYPEMRYQVGRACAIGGYTKLYQNLNLLPEVTIAEEARESGSTDIYDDIVKATLRYQVFDDYTGSLNHANPRPGARLNGDTCLRSWLHLRQPIRPPVGLIPGEEGDPAPRDEEDPELNPFSNEPDYMLPGFPGYYPPPFNVTEDMQVGPASSLMERTVFDSPDWDPEESLKDPDAPRDPPDELSDVVTRLLWQPLPEDLPTCDKDWLIRMAAYNGNTDRYVRLRRPSFVKWELDCVERGIYHNVLFARWWASQNLDTCTTAQRLTIEQAIHARYIMSDDLSRALGQSFGAATCPYFIWYPDIASEDTYKALAVHFPHTRPQVMRAAIYADYQGLFDLLISEAGSCLDEFHYREAVYSVNPHYKTVVLSKAAELGIDVTHPDWHAKESRCVSDFHKQREDITPFKIKIMYPIASYTCSARRLEFYVLSRKDWRMTPEQVKNMGSDEEYILGYENWPDSVWKPSGPWADTLQQEKEELEKKRLADAPKEE